MLVVCPSEIDLLPPVGMLTGHVLWMDTTVFPHMHALWPHLTLKHCRAHLLVIPSRLAGTMAYRKGWPEAYRERF